MARSVRWRRAVCTAVSACVFWGAPVVLFAKGPVHPAGLGMTPEALMKAPGQNRMVWVACPKVRKPPAIDGTLRLEQGEWDSACAIYGMLDPRPGLLMPLAALTFITWDEDSFYVGMRTEVKRGYVLRRRLRDMDSAVHRDDAVELIFNPLGRDQPEPAIFQVICNALGTRWDAMQTVGVSAKYWDAREWEFASDYVPGMEHWDLEVRVPIRSMRMKGRNQPGQCWLMVATRDWKWLIDDRGRTQWNVYSSLTGNGGFISQENQLPLVLDPTAPVVQLVDLSALCAGRFGLKARFANTTARAQKFTAEACVYDNTGFAGRDQDWTLRERPLIRKTRDFTLKPGETASWVVPVSALPELEVGPAKRAKAVYGFAFKVSRPESAVPLFVRQRDFVRRDFRAKTSDPGLPMGLAYNPVRNTIVPSCDILDVPDKERVQGLKVEVYPAGERAAGAPWLSELMTRRRNHILAELLPVPELKPGSYPARLTLLDTNGRAFATKDGLAIRKLDEAREFPWWDSRAGLSDQPAPPHRAMRYEGTSVLTSTGKTTFDGSGLPVQMQMTGKDLLAAPVWLTASADGEALRFVSAAAADIGKKTPVEARLRGLLRCAALTVRARNRMEYDGAQWITLDLEPGRPELPQLHGRVAHSPPARHRCASPLRQHHPLARRLSLGQSGARRRSSALPDGRALRARHLDAGFRQMELPEGLREGRAHPDVRSQAALRIPQPRHARQADRPGDEPRGDPPPALLG